MPFPQLAGKPTLTVEQSLENVEPTGIVVDEDERVWLLGHVLAEPAGIRIRPR
jgi:hypothetical protein